MNTSTQQVRKSILFLAAVFVLAVPVLEGCAAKGAKTAAATDTTKKAVSKPVEMFDTGSTLHTLTNLHPDPKKHQLYSSNFLLEGDLIPRCTAVKVVDANKKRFVFTIKDVEYKYDLNPHSTPDGLDADLKQYFGKSCDAGAVSKLSATDQKGIREGKAYVGMSKQGVIYAIGYPPVTPTTPSMSAPVWKYFHNRFNTMNVEFNGNTVSKIVD